MHQNRLSVCSTTTVGQKLPENWEEKVINFCQFLSQQREELAIQADHVLFNMNKVCRSFDIPYCRTVDTTRAKSVPVSTTGHKKTGLTVVPRKTPQQCDCLLPQQRMDG